MTEDASEKRNDKQVPLLVGAFSSGVPKPPALPRVLPAAPRRAATW